MMMIIYYLTDILPVESEKGPFYVQNTPLIRIQALAACYFDPNHVISKISIAILAKKMSLIEPDFRKQLKSTGILAEYTQLLRNSLIKEEKIRLWQKQQSTRLEQLKTEQKAISFMFDQNVNEIEQICVTIKVLIEDVDEMIQEGIDEGLVNLLLERLNEINEYKQKIIAKRIQEEQEIDDLIDVDIEMSRIVVPPILIYVLCPFSGTTNANKKLLIECGMLQGLIPLVWSRNKDMQSNILDSIFNLVVGGSNITKESDPHPYYKICEKEKLIDKLLLVCEREKLEEQINNEKFNEEMQFLKDERNRLLSESGNNSKDNKNKLNDDESDNQNEQIDDEMSGMEIRATSTFIISFIMRHQKLEQKHERIIDILKTLLEKCCSFEKKEEMQNYLELRNKRRKQLDTLRKQKEQVRENDQQDPYSSISLKRRDVYSYTTQIPNNVNQLGYNQQQQQQTQNPDMQQQLKKALRKSKNPQSQTGLIPSSAFSSSNSDDLTYQQQSGSIKRNQLRTRNQYFGQPISDQLGLNLDNDSQQQSMSNTISSISPRSRSPRLFTVTQQFNNQYTQPLLSSSSFNNNNNNTSLLPQSDSSLNYGSNLNNRYDFQSQFTTPMTTMSKQQAKQLNDLKQKLQATRQLRDGMTQTSAQNSLRPNTANTNIQQPYQQYNSQNQDPIRATQSLNFGQPSGLDQQYIQNTQQQQQWLMQNFNVWQGSGKDLVWMTKTALSSLRYLAMEVANHTYFIDDLMLETLDKMLIIWSFRASPPIESQTKDDDEDEDEKKEKKRNAEQVLNKLLCTIEIILIKGNAQTKRMIISLAKRTDDENNQNDDDDDEDQRNKGKQNKPRKFKSRPKWETLITKHLKADSIELKQVSKIILKKLSGDDSDSDDEDEDEKKEQTAIGEPQGEGDEDDDYDDDDEEDDEVVDAGGKKKNDDEDDDDDF
ncbi:MAG: hypothetical protein EZS28_008207 [Streblomastix strix]|uniref:Uncharacterized protein n=1 Tax=Streblomastix strix TaxID=222440 RepID=A0A5J4WPA6_9EUKA|nr:MAG: hypothetical protein EZS28_008207 [Streblomastix strix]